MASSTPTQSPTRREQPNPHPYAIKTTSTGILTRSNSSKAHGSWARHKYTPFPSSPSAFVFDPPDSSPNAGHRHTKSTPDAQPSPVNQSRRLESPQRSESSFSMSSSASDLSKSWVGREAEGEQVKLPRHPYLWSPGHLSTYLSTVLSDSDGEALDPELVQKIVDFIQDQKIGGRAFLGLDQEDFQEMSGVDSTWREALWDASCTLRDGTKSYRPSRVSSSSYKRGRVRGIVGVFERSASESSDVSDDDAPRQSPNILADLGSSKVNFRPQNRNRGWSVSGSEDESTKRQGAPRSPFRNAGPTGAAESFKETEMHASHLQSHTLEDYTEQRAPVEIVSVPKRASHADDSLPIDAPPLVISEFPPRSVPVADVLQVEPSEPDLPDDVTPNDQEVEIVSLHGRANSEPTMAELYEQTYGVSPPAAPSPRPFSPSAADPSDDENPPGETVKISAAPLSPQALRPVVRRRPALSPPPASLTQLFVPSLVPEQPGGVEPHDVYVLPVRNMERDEAAWSLLDALKLRLEVVERRLEAMERKDAGASRTHAPKVNGDASAAADSTAQEFGSTWRNDGTWEEGVALRSRYSAYILLAGATTGVSVVLVPVLLRHLWSK